MFYLIIFSIDPSNHDDNYAHTNYFTNGVNKVDIWTNHWFIWSGTGKTLGLRYSARVHVDTKWENDKVAEQLFYADMSAHKMESEMFKQSQ